MELLEKYEKLKYISEEIGKAAVAYSGGVDSTFLAKVSYDVLKENSVFGIVTILTMTSIVLLMTSGLRFVKLDKMERYSHALAGLTIFVSGLAVQFLGL